MSSSDLALSPPCKPCPLPTDNGIPSESSTPTTTSPKKVKSPSHVGILLTFPNSESSSSWNDEYHDNVISLASHLLTRGHQVTIVVAFHAHSSSSNDNNEKQQDEKKNKSNQKNGQSVVPNRIKRIPEMIFDHLSLCEGEDDRDRFLLLYNPPLEEDEDDHTVFTLSSSSSSSYSQFLDLSGARPSSEGVGVDSDIIALLQKEHRRRPFHALVMDSANVAGMLWVEFYRIPSILLHHAGHRGTKAHGSTSPTFHSHGEMMIRNSKQLKSFLLSQADDNKRSSSSSSSSPASVSSFLAMPWQSFVERVHNSWVDLQLGRLPFLQYNRLRQRCGLTMLRRLLPDVWQASGSILVHIQQTTGPTITGVSTISKRTLQRGLLLPVDNNQDDDDLPPNFIAMQGPVVPPCFPCNDNSTDENSPHPPCLLTLSAKPSPTLTSSTKSIWSSSWGSISSSAATTTITTPTHKKQNIILLDDSLPYSSSSLMGMTESAQVQMQFANGRKLLQALTLARDSIASWQHHSEDASSTLMNTTTPATSADNSNTLFNVIRLEESKVRDQGNGGDNSDNKSESSLLASRDTENRDLQPEFLKSHVATTFLDAVSYYSHSPDHFQLLLVMTNRCHEHHSASQSQQQDDKRTHGHHHHHNQHWLETMYFPVLCIRDDEQETVRQLALRILRELPHRDEVVHETASTAITATNSATCSLQSDNQTATMDHNNNKEQRPPVLRLVKLIEGIAHVQKNPRIAWKTGLELRAELLERVVVPWNHRQNIHYNVSTSQSMSLLSPVTVGHPSHQPTPRLVSMAWLILVFSGMYLFLQKAAPGWLSHRTGGYTSSGNQRLQQQDDEQQRHGTLNGESNNITNGTIRDSNSSNGHFSDWVQGMMWSRLSHLDLAWQMLQDWVNAELEKYHHSQPAAKSDAAVNNEGDIGVSGPRRRNNAKKKRS
jgi:hypothetical protein